MKIHADRDQAVRVLGALLKSYEERRYPFNLPWVSPPQVPQNMPKTLRLGTREHALFLFVVCYWMKGGVESDTAFRNLSRIYDSRPEFFLPEYVDERYDESDLFEAIRHARLGLVGNAEFWARNHRRLRDWWMCDPVTCFVGVRTYEQALAYIRNNRRSGRSHRGFIGFQEKMVSMIIYFYMDAGFVSPFNFPIPVDVHVARAMIAHEIVKVEFADEKEAAKGFYVKPILDKMRQVLYWFSSQRKADPLELCNALWLLGKNLCGETPGNDSIGSGGKGRRITITPVPLTWNDAQRRAYETTCGLCPVEKTCRYNIPSGPYYRKGVLGIRGSRAKPPAWNAHLIPPQAGFMPPYEVGAYKNKQPAGPPPPNAVRQIALELPAE